MDVIIVSGIFILGLAMSLLLAEAALCAICLLLKPHSGSACLATPDRLWNAARQPTPEFALARCAATKCCWRQAKHFAENSSASPLVSAGADGTLNCRSVEYDVERAKGGTGPIMTGLKKVA